MGSGRVRQTRNRMTGLGTNGIGLFKAVLIITCQDMIGIWLRLLARVLLAVFGKRGLTALTYSGWHGQPQRERRRPFWLRCDAAQGKRS